MARPQKPLDHEKLGRVIVIMKAIKQQPPKAPHSKKDIAEALGYKASEITDEVGIIERRGWVKRRTGPDARGIYFKLEAGGKKAIAAYDLLYG